MRGHRTHLAPVARPLDVFEVGVELAPVSQVAVQGEPEVRKGFRESHRGRMVGGPQQLVAADVGRRAVNGARHNALHDLRLEEGVRDIQGGQ